MISDKHITTPHERVKVTSVTWLPRSNSWIRLLKFILQASSFRMARELAWERASEWRSHEGLALASPFACYSCVTSGGVPQSFFAVYLITHVYCFAWFYALELDLRTSLSHGTFFSWTNSWLMQGCEKCVPHSQTHRKNSSRNWHSISNSFSKKYWNCYYIPESAHGQDEANPEFWLTAEPILPPRHFPL